MSDVDVERDRIEHVLRTTYRDDFYDGRLSTTASFFLEDRRSTTHVPSSGTVVSDSITPLAGLSLLDQTPEVGSLESTPSLIDGDESTPTGINIGGFPSGGITDWNIGVELPADSMVKRRVSFD